MQRYERFAMRELWRQRKGCVYPQRRARAMRDSGILIDGLVGLAVWALVVLGVLVIGGSILAAVFG